MLLLEGDDDTKCLTEGEEAHAPESHVSATGKKGTLIPNMNTRVKA